MPSLAWVPLLILWMKIGEDSKITLIAIGAFFPVYTTVAAALRHVDRHLVEVGRAFGLRGVRLFSSVQLPAVAAVGRVGPAARARAVVAVPGRRRAHRVVDGPRASCSSTPATTGASTGIILAIILLALLGKLTDSLIGLAEKYLLKRWA